MCDMLITRSHVHTAVRDACQASLLAVPFMLLVLRENRVQCCCLLCMQQRLDLVLLSTPIHWSVLLYMQELPNIHRHYTWWLFWRACGVHTEVYKQGGSLRLRDVPCVQQHCLHASHKQHGGSCASQQLSCCHFAYAYAVPLQQRAGCFIHLILLSQSMYARVDQQLITCRRAFASDCEALRCASTDS